MAQNPHVLRFLGGIRKKNDKTREPPPNKMSPNPFFSRVSCFFNFFQKYVCFLTFSGRGGLAWGLGMCLSLALALGLAFGPGPRLGSGPGPGPGSGLCVWAFLLGLALAPGGRQPAQASPAHYRQTSRPTRCIIHFFFPNWAAVPSANTTC